MRTLAVDAEYAPQDALAESSVFAVADPATSEPEDLVESFDEGATLGAFLPRACDAWKRIARE